MEKLTPYSRIAIAVSALILVSAYYLPLWQILMWAPQYPEGLDMKIWINDITGDVKIISALNHYIGMKHIEVSMFPEFGYMIYIVGAVIATGIITALINRRVFLFVYASIIVACGLAALIDFYLWGYDYGHNLDPTAPIVVPGMSYQPPLIGTKQLLNFTAFSGPDIGGWIFMASGAISILVLGFELFGAKKYGKKITTPVAVISILCLTTSSCSVKPEPLQYGRDACYHCKMTLMDERFGGEIVSVKGKIFKFDDANCLINFIKTEEVAKEDLAHCLIADFANPGSLINAHEAFYVSSQELRSPMGGNVAAFEQKQEQVKHNDDWHGTPLSWNELINLPK